MSTVTQSTATRAFARVLGPFFAIVSATVVARAANMRVLLTEFGASAVWPWVTGAFVLMAGITVVALHPYWRGLTAIIVSMLGWIMVIRGILLMAFPDFFIAIANRTIGAENLWRVVFAVFIAIGVYLTYAGWIARPKPTISPAVSSTPDLPRAA
ncbi:hypothetical protein [Mycolicibacterium brisbanense]|nr:hypothetical protein [Mycolicibacterium brisbanense]MCV7155965.1 hypothetical protein [Mycolicibacterium brisbanense]